MDDENRTEPAGPSAVPGLAAGSGPVAERMQALLSRAVEDQLVEQRQVSGVLNDLRQQVAALGEGMRGAATSVSLQQLAGELDAQSAEVRRTYALLSERLDGMARRVEDATAQAKSGGQGAEHLAVRVTGLSADLAGVGSAVDELSGAVNAFPTALATLQRDLAGLHDRIAPLADVRDHIAELAQRPGADSLRPELETLRQLVEGRTSEADFDRLRDNVVQGVAARMDRVEALVDRPTVSPEGLHAALAGLAARLDSLPEYVAPLSDRLQAVEHRLGSVGERVAEVGDAAGGVPALATDLARLSAKVDELGSLREELSGVRGALAGVREELSASTVPLALASLRGDIEGLHDRLADLAIPTPEQVAAEVAPRVADRLVDGLAPRVSDLVLAKVGAVLVEQVSATAAQRVLAGITDMLRDNSADSERRILAHVDDAVLALAEALLRRRRPRDATAAAAAALVPGAAALVPDPLLAEPAPAGPLTDPAALSFAELSTAIGATEAPPVPVVFEDAVLPADKVLDELAAAGYDEDDELAGDEPADESPEEFEAAAAPGVEAGSLPDQEHSASDASSAAQQAPADEPAVAAVAVDEDGEPVAGAVGTDAQRLEAEPAAATPQPAVDEPAPGEDVVADEEPPAVAPAHRPHTQTVDSWPQLSDPATPEPFEQVPDVQADPAVQAEQVPDVYAEPAVQAEQAVEAEQVPDVHAELAVQAEPAASEPLDRADTGEPADPSVASATEPLPHPVPSPARFSVPPSPELDEAVGESVRAARPIRPAVTGGMAPPRQRPAVPSRENQTDPAAPSGSAAADDEDGDGRRRPWWRPGG